jgi:hypothetical protein
VRSLEVSEVGLTIINGDGHAIRAERIARLTFDYVRELMERELQHLDSDVSVDRLAVPPIRVTLDTMDDEAVARASAAAIHRAVIAAM